MSKTQIALAISLIANMVLIGYTFRPTDKPSNTLLSVQIEKAKQEKESAMARISELEELRKQDSVFRDSVTKVMAQRDSLKFVEYEHIDNIEDSNLIDSLAAFNARIRAMFD